jgi:hypothetical protein
MAFFEDLSEYGYFARHCRPGSRNIGWLVRGHDFDKMPPSDETLDLLWSFCRINVMQARGFHPCGLCDISSTYFHAIRDGLRLALGSAEIRVFSSDGTAYAAPNLIYHYVRTHHYKPPLEFMAALASGPRPMSDKYVDLLAWNQLDWKEAQPASPDIRAFRFEKINGELRRIELEFPIHLDEN